MAAMRYGFGCSAARLLGCSAARLLGCSAANSTPLQTESTIAASS